MDKTDKAHECGALFGHDGSRWEIEGGRTLREVALEDFDATENRVADEDGEHGTYSFPDGSSIVSLDGGWDYANPLGCGCWESEHFVSCPHSPRHGEHLRAKGL